MFNVSSRSRVSPMSRIDLTPALTTTSGIAASAPRSADSSKVSGAPWCTPPSPPVENTRTPASCAANAVAATVVPALRPFAIAMGRSRMDALTTASSFDSPSISAVDRPTTSSPENTPIVAGVTPDARSHSSDSSATSRLRGRGSPCVKIVDSRASTGRPEATASRTSAETRTAELISCDLSFRERTPPRRPAAGRRGGWMPWRPASAAPMRRGRARPRTRTAGRARRGRR